MKIAWWQLDMRVPAAAAAAVEAQLLDAGAEAVTFLEGDDSEAVFDEGDIWQNSRCEALFAADSHSETTLRNLVRDNDWRPYAAHLTALEEQDWVAATQAAFPARCFGRLWVTPSWDAAPASAPRVLHLDPGQAFGTGAHATTALCLRFLDTQIRGGESLIDYGCGSGILAIAGLLLGAGQAFGVDTDPVALQVAAANAERNGISAGLQLALPENARLPLADILVANILATPLLTLAPALAHSVRPGGWIALSGILHHQEAEIHAAYEPYFDLAVAQHEEDWSLLYGQRNTGV